ncbi:hypothetical protein [Paludifilum halophilum]|uniref:hypothetical protein n=1 Tax=Paludifilum halophilum TaxID=1642702 RepID=UPI001F0A49D0|nr:hypothetical protein [Paludifilum halophilum]
MAQRIGCRLRIPRRVVVAVAGLVAVGIGGRQQLPGVVVGVLCRVVSVHRGGSVAHRIGDSGQVPFRVIVESVLPPLRGHLLGEIGHVPF